MFPKFQRHSWIKREYPHSIAQSLLKKYLFRAERELYRTLSLDVCERFKIVTWRRTTKSGLIINLLEQKTRYRLFKVVIKLWYELYIHASYFIPFNKYTNTSNNVITANDDEMIIFLTFVARFQVTILRKRKQP